MLAEELQKKYETSVIPVNCTDIDLDDINKIFTEILYEFRIERINIKFPRWVDGLDENNSIKQELYKEIKEALNNTCKLKDVNEDVKSLQKTEIIERSIVESIELGTRKCYY